MFFLFPTFALKSLFIIAKPAFLTQGRVVVFYFAVFLAHKNTGGGYRYAFKIGLRI
jgi:hypothetical protein